MNSSHASADPGIFVRRGGARKQSGQLFIYLFVLVLIGVFYNLQKESNDLLWGNLYSSKDQEGVLGGGVQLSRGVQLFPEGDPFANF